MAPAESPERKIALADHRGNGEDRVRERQVEGDLDGRGRVLRKL